MPATKHGHDPDVEITPAEIAKLLERPPSFAYFGDDKDHMFVDWTLGTVIRHRDSGLLDQSNARVLIKHLESDPTLADDWRVTECSHWAVGHVDHLSYRVKESDGSPTRVARVIRAFYDALQDYPVASDDDYSMMEHEASWDWICQETPRMASRLGFILPEGENTGADQVMTWLSDNRPNALESRDDQGASPDEDDYRDAFEALGYAREPE